MLDDIKKTRWATADKLRANMDAAEYKHLVLGLIFIKHISDNSIGMFKQLKAQQAVIDTALGAKLEWMALPDGHACRILQVRPESPLESEDQWTYCAWLEQAALRMSEVFRPLLKELN